MPLLICCKMPEPCEPLRHADGRRDLIDCIDDVSKNGTLDEVFGIEPPYTHHSVVAYVHGEKFLSNFGKCNEYWLSHAN
ncbi:unnamed protein product, partial [Brenthis ino]